MRKPKVTMAFIACLLVSAFALAPGMAFATNDAVATNHSKPDNERAYSTLQSAIDNADSSTDDSKRQTIVLQADVTESITVGDGTTGYRGITIDLNGHTVTSPAGSQSPVFTFKEDCYDIVLKNGTIVQNNEGVAAMNTNAGASKITLEGITASSTESECIISEGSTHLSNCKISASIMKDSSKAAIFADSGNHGSYMYVEEGTVVTRVGDGPVTKSTDVEDAARDYGYGITMETGSKYSNLPTSGRLGSDYVFLKHAATGSGEADGYYEVVSALDAQTVTECSVKNYAAEDETDFGPVYFESDDDALAFQAAHEGSEKTGTGSHTAPLKPEQGTKTSLSSAKVTLSSSSYAYNGKIQQPSVKSVVLDGKTLTSGADYTASVTSGKKVGTYKVTVTGTGSYAGTATATYTITPKSITGLKLKKAKKSFKASWTKYSTERSGVQVRYSTKSSMKGAKTVKAAGASAKAKTVKKLKKKTKYYVQVRSYKVVGGKTYYSTWSAKKSVKTK